MTSRETRDLVSLSPEYCFMFNFITNHFVLCTLVSEFVAGFLSRVRSDRCSRSDYFADTSGVHPQPGTKCLLVRFQLQLGLATYQTSQPTFLQPLQLFSALQWL